MGSLLPDASLVLKPDLDRRAGSRGRATHPSARCQKVFKCLLWLLASFFGWGGRGCRRIRPNFAQPLAHRALMHRAEKRRVDYRLQIRTPPPHHLVLLRIGTGDNQRASTPPSVRPSAVGARPGKRLRGFQAVDARRRCGDAPGPAGVVRSIPDRSAASLRGSPSNASAIASSTANLGRVVALAGRGPQIHRAVVRPRNRQCLTHPMNPSRRSTRWEPSDLNSSNLTGIPPEVRLNADRYKMSWRRSENAAFASAPIKCGRNKVGLTPPRRQLDVARGQATGRGWQTLGSLR